MKKYYMYILLEMLILVAFLTGCSPKAKSDQEIMNDVKDDFLYNWSFVDFDDIDIEVYKRQTNKEEKIDFAWVTVAAENDEISMEVSYEVEYALYNDGWELEEINYSKRDYQVKKSSVTEDDALSIVTQNYQDVYEEIVLLQHDTDLAYRTDTFVFEGTYSEGYVTITDHITVCYEYSLRDRWYNASHQREEIFQNWSVGGRWSYKLGDNEMWIDIVDLNNGMIGIEYDFDYDCIYETAFYGWKKTREQYASNGIETRTIDYTDDGFCFNLLEDESTTPYIYITKYGGLTFDGWWANEDDSYVFYYNGGNGYQTRIDSGQWSDEAEVSKMPIVGYTEMLDTIISAKNHLGETITTVFGYVQRNGKPYTGSNTYNLYGQYKTLTGQAFLTEHADFGSHGEVRILGDGEVLYSIKAESFTKDHCVDDINISVDGVEALTIECTGDYVTEHDIFTIEHPTIGFTELIVHK